MNSFYAAIIVVCTFLVTVIFVCYKLARQNNRIEGNYSPVRMPPRTGAKLRKPKTKTIAYKASTGTQTLNVNVLYAAFKKESVTCEPATSETSCITSVDDNKVVKLEAPELYTNSEHFYQNPSLAYETVADIHRPSSKYTSLPN